MIRSPTPNLGRSYMKCALGEMAALHEVPFGLYYGSVDSTPLFVILAGRYAQTPACGGCY
jgi:glycogen debranching enzyme